MQKCPLRSLPFAQNTQSSNRHLLRLIRFLLSLMPEKEAKRAFRNRNPCDASQRTCRRKRHAHASPQASRFLNARIVPFAQHPDSELITSALFGSHRNRHVRGERIGSAHCDFDRFLLSHRSTTPYGRRLDSSRSIDPKGRSTNLRFVDS